MWRVACLAVCAVAVCGCGSSSTTGTPRQRIVMLPGHPAELSVEPPAAVKRAGRSRLAQFELGRSVMAESGCLACHKIGNNGNAGPGQDLTGVGARLSPLAIEDAIIHAREPMPSFVRLPKAKLKALVEFLSLLRRQGPS